MENAGAGDLHEHETRDVSDEVRAIAAEIERAFGYVPTIFLPAFGHPRMLRYLWDATRDCYLDLHLPTAFTEEVLAYLARHCSTPFCLLFHSCSAFGAGASASSLLRLLKTPVPCPPPAVEEAIGLLQRRSHGDAWTGDEELERALIICTEERFMSRPRARDCAAATQRLIGEGLDDELVRLMSFTRTLHLFTESHPEICFGLVPPAAEHLDELLAEEPTLGDVFLHYWERMSLSHAQQEELLASLQDSEAVRRSERLYHRLADAAPDMVFRLRLRPRHELEYVSPAAAELTGFTPEELYENPGLLRTILVPEDRPKLDALLDDPARVPQPAMLRWVRKDGTLVYTEHHLARVGDDGGELVGVEGIVRDVSERMRAEEILHQSHVLLREVFESMQEGVLVLTPERRVVLANPAVRRMLGLTGEELEGLSAESLHVDRAHFDAFGERIRSALDKGEVAQFSFELRRADGSVFPTEHTISPLLDPAGRRIGMVSVIRDASERASVERELRDSEARWRTLVETAPHFVVLVDRAHRIRFVNHPDLFPDPSSAAPDASFLDWFLPASREKVRGGLEEVFQRGGRASFEAEARGEGGRVFWLDVRMAPLSSAPGEETAIVNCVDITSRREGELKLERSQARLTSLMKSSPQYVLEVDRDLRILFINHAAEGVKAEDVVGRTLLDYLPEGRHAETRERFLRVFETGKPFATYRTIAEGSHGTRWYEVTVGPVIEEGRIQSLVVNATDITERVRDEEALRASEQKWRTLVQYLPDHIVSLDREGRVVFSNRGIAGALGGDGMLGRRIYDLVAPHLRDRLREVLARVFDTGIPASYEVFGTGPGGMNACYQSSVGPVLENGRVAGAMVVSTDITDRKLAENALRDSEERFRRIFEEVPVGMAMVGSDLKLLQVNGAFRQMFDCKSEHVVGRGASLVCSKESSRAVGDALHRVFSGEMPRLDLETRLRQENGRPFWGRLTGSALRDENGIARYVLLMFEDIELRKRNEDELRMSERQMTLAQQIAHVGSWDWDLRSGEVTVSAEMFRIAGRAPGKTLPLETFLSYIHPEDAGRVREAVHAAIADQKPFDFEHRLVREDGTQRIIHARGEAVFVRGHPVRVVGTGVDITSRRQDEHERERLLQEAHDALRARDEFLAMASHDLRSPLNALKLQMDSLMRKSQRTQGAMPDWMRAGLASSSRQVDRLVLLINGLLDVSRIGTGRIDLRPEELDLAELGQEVAGRMRTELEDAGCAFSLDAPAPLLAKVDRMRVEQVLANLLSNAIKYGRGAPVELGVAEREGRAVLRVTDHGVGIAPADHERIFQRFERTPGGARKAAGFGLGLWIVRRIVDAMGGRVQVISAPGKGSTFEVTLPLRPQLERSEPRR